VDGCEILHHQKDGGNPNEIMGCLPPTWWLIPLSKWVITPVISGLTLLIPFITGVITHLLSGMSHQVSTGAGFLHHPLVIEGSHHGTANNLPLSCRSLVFTEVIIEFWEDHLITYVLPSGNLTYYQLGIFINKNSHKNSDFRNGLLQLWPFTSYKYL